MTRERARVILENWVQYRADMGLCPLFPEKDCIIRWPSEDQNTICDYTFFYLIKIAYGL